MVREIQAGDLADERMVGCTVHASAPIGHRIVTGKWCWHACPVEPEEHADPPEQRPPQHVRIVHLTAPVFRALVNGDLTAANRASPVPLSAYFAGPECRAVWQRRSKQVEDDPASAAWVTGVIWDERQQVAVGRAGYHGPPDPSGMVEIGYAVDPAYRRRGYARAALEALLQRAAREPRVRTVRVTISPDNVASYRLASQYGFTEVGEQWDDEDGLEIIYELDAQRR
jgi:RimJ/RimL family protein N-acetyltransferase